jgi:hypothetical protein
MKTLSVSRESWGLKYPSGASQIQQVDHTKPLTAINVDWPEMLKPQDTEVEAVNVRHTGFKFVMVILKSPE